GGGGGAGRRGLLPVAAGWTLPVPPPAAGLTVPSPQLQEAFSRGALKPGLNVVLEERPKRRNDVNGLKQCLSEFRQQLEWVERLDITLGQVVDPTSQSASNKEAVDPENDFQREMSFYRQAQAAVLEALPRLHKLQIPTRRPDDYFAEMAKSDQQMQKIRQKLKSKQEAMERSEKAKQLRAMRKYGKKVRRNYIAKIHGICLVFNLAGFKEDSKRWDTLKNK
uniref:EBNA1 binding protein 2 n=1 Tax=Falco tinnunculus TaxID=100819 RepID=A0A8C4XUI1_FALTI